MGPFTSSFIPLPSGERSTRASQMKNFKKVPEKIKTLLCQAVNTTGHQYGLDICNEYGRHGAVMKNGRAGH